MADAPIAKPKGIVFKECEEAERHLRTGGTVAHLYYAHPFNREVAANTLRGRGWRVKIEGETVIVERHRSR